jgi:hypothetical protein
LKNAFSFGIEETSINWKRVEGPKLTGSKLDWIQSFSIFRKKMKKKVQEWDFVVASVPIIAE